MSSNNTIFSSVDFSKKKKFSKRRFSIELSVLFLLICLLDFFFSFDIKYFTEIFYILLFYSSICIILPNLIIPFKFIFEKLFFLISKITNPILVIFTYIIGILPIGIYFRFKKLVFKNKNTTESYWQKENLNSLKINIDDQY